eukprot:s454_g17.t2
MGSLLGTALTDTFTVEDAQEDPRDLEVFPVVFEERLQGSRTVRSVLESIREAGPGKLSLLHGTRKVSPSAKISDLELADDDFLCLIKRATGSYTSWEEDRPLEADCMVKCVLLGAASAGKTSWLQAVCREDIGDSYRATIGVDFKMKRLKSEEGTKIKPQLWDVAGTPRVLINGTPRDRDRAQREGSAPANGSNPRFLQLFQDSVQKKYRLYRLKQQVERDQEQRTQASAQVAPGTTRYAAWQRRGDTAALGERLHNDAAKRALKMRHLQEMVEEERRLQEQQEATFRPAIEVSQRRCQGTSRSLQDPEGLKKRMKMQRLRNMQEKAELDGCTFKPEIDQKSEELISQRLARLKITGTLYDSLYEDAIRRRERQLESLRALPPGVTFQPDIGMDHYRPPNDETKEDFLNRLAYSKSYSERWLSLRRQSQENGFRSKDREQPEFHPQTGRGPLVERNRAGLPIGDFLYEFGRGKATSVTAQVPQDPDQSPAPKMGDNSRQLFEETKRRSYRHLFDSLTANDPEGQLAADTITLDGQDADLCEFLRPLVSFLEATGKRIDFSAFGAAMDLQRQQAVTPTAHLFARNAAKNGKVKGDEEPPVPRIDHNSLGPRRFRASGF